MMRMIIKEIETSGVWDLVKIVVSCGRFPMNIPIESVRKALNPVGLVYLLVEVSAYCVNFHNTDLASSSRLRTGSKIMIERISLLRL